MAEYDLTKTMMKYLDRHMVLPVLEWLAEKQLYNERDLRLGKLELVSKTSMVDFAVENYEECHGTKEIPAELETQREHVYKQLSETQKACGPFCAELNVDKIRELQENKQFDVAYLSSKYNVTLNNIKALYPFAKLMFDCGRYADAAENLYNFRELNTDADKGFWALWGKLAAEILMVNLVDAREDLKELRDLIDNRQLSDHLDQLNQRTWLLHWGLFVFFNLDTDESGQQELIGMQDLIEFCFQDKMMNTIQTTCPHLLRYVTIAVVVTQNRKQVMRDLLRILNQERSSFRDPVTEFLLAIYTDFDFELGYKKLQECTELVKSDFFLENLASEQKIGEKFIKNARRLFFETYCNLYTRIDTSQIAKTLGFAEDDDSLPKIVAMIRESNMTAKIDAEKQQLVVPTSSRSVHKQIVSLDKEKNLSERTRKLIAQVEKKYSLLAEANDV